MATAGYALDSSFCGPLFLDEIHSLWARRTLAEIDGREFWVPSLWPLEISNVLINAHRRKRLDDAALQRGLLRASELELQVDNHIHQPLKLGQLAARQGLTTYDASYFELAQRRKLTLVSLDSALLAAAQKAGLKVLTAPSQ